MSEYQTAAVHQLNKWLWAQLKTLDYKTGKAFKAYTGAGGTINLVPIVPSQQIAQFTDISGGAPFLVYNYTEVGSTMWEQRRQNIVWVIYDNDEERLRTIHNYMVDLLGRGDWVAQDVNDWLMANPDNEPGTSGNAFEFKTIFVTTASGPEPFESQGGRQAALVSCWTMYTHDLDGRGLRV